MDYQTLIREVRTLDFIKDDEMADAFIKAVLGILASELEVEPAHQMTDQLPEPLTFERLRSHQARPLNISFQESIAEISHQFNIRPDLAQKAVKRVYHVLKLALEPSSIDGIRNGLPAEWAHAFSRA